MTPRGDCPCQANISGMGAAFTGFRSYAVALREGIKSGMNPPKVTDEDYLNFLIATPKGYSATEAARVQPEKPMRPAQDAFTRLLHRLEPDAATRWHEAAGQGERPRGILVIDDIAATTRRGMR